jgi:thiol:disulfide interchange protein DsbG
MLIDKSGTDLSQQYQQTYIPHLAPPDIVSSLDQDPLLVEEGQAKAPMLYVFADANCSFCNSFWNALRPYLQTGKVRVRWAMLAFLKDTSTGRAAAILAAKDRVAALTQDEAQFDKQKEEGGIAPLDRIPTELRAELALHAQQMSAMGGQGTPLILFRRGGQWLVSDGLPKDMPGFVAGLDKGS